MLARLVALAAALAIPSAALAQAPAPPPGPTPAPTTAPADPNAYPPYPPYPPPQTTVMVGPPPDPPGEVEMIADFGAVGLLAGITIDVRGVHDSSLGTMVILGSTAGGGAVGYLLADKFQATRGDAYLTTLGLGVGLANGAFLLEPLHASDAEHVLGVLTLSSAIGASAGFAVSRGEKLTPGQALFATDLTFLGVGSAALIASLEDDNGSLDDGEVTTLAIGLDAGAAAGLLLAPKIDWSQRRARMVGVGTLAGTFLGGMVAGLAAPRRKNPDGSTSTDFDPDFVSTALLLGAWGGFGASIYLTKDMPTDPKFDPRYQTAAGPPVTVMPVVRGDGFGAALGGTF